MFVGKRGGNPARRSALSCPEPNPLKGDLKGFWSAPVRARWRIVFRFEEADAFAVELVDYH
jgi:proteic killer suppression protein